MSNFQKGDRVVLVKRDGKMIEGTYSHVAPNGKCYVKGDDGIAYERGATSLRKTGDAETNFDYQAPDGEQQSSQEPKIDPTIQFDINKRFEFLGQLVRMVVNGTSVSLVVTGEGGLGKTYEVKEALLKKQLVEGEDWHHVKGYSTARGLYRTLWDYQEDIIVFDDCDSILEDKVALNLLKGALDSYDVRKIHWLSQTFDETVPSEFEFKGKIIFISNKNMHSMNQAILSRANSVDLTMSLEDKLTRMEAILPKVKSHIPMAKKQECLELIRKYSHICHDLNIRTLIKTIEIRIDPENKENWQDLAIYGMTNTVS